MARPSHSDHVLQQLNNQREWGFLCDCLIAVGDTYFRAHKAVLAACSSYFRMLFIRDQQGAGRLDLSNMHISAECFDLILQLMYLGRIAVGGYEFEELKASMAHLQMYYIPDSLDDLRDIRSSTLAPSSSSSSTSSSSAGPVGGKMMFGVRMFDQQRPAATNETERPAKVGSSTGVGRPLAPPTTSNSSRVLAVEEVAAVVKGPLMVAPLAAEGSAEQPCDLRKRSGGGKSTSLKERPRFGRTYTCDDCGFVFSCEKLLIEHILTCTNRKAFQRPLRDAGESAKSAESSASEGSSGGGGSAGEEHRVMCKGEEEEEAAVSGSITGVAIKTEVEMIPVGVLEKTEGAEGGSSSSEESCVPAKLRKVKEEEEEPKVGSDSSPCEVCGELLAEEDKSAHYLSSHMGHVCACGRCGQVLIRGRQLQEHAERCGESGGGDDGEDGEEEGEDGRASLMLLEEDGEDGDEPHSVMRMMMMEEEEDEEEEGDGLLGEVGELSCSHCGLLFQTESLALEHALACHEQELLLLRPPRLLDGAGGSVGGEDEPANAAADATAPSADHHRRKHFCAICGKGFFQRCHLREHHTVHTRQKQFTCSTCGKQFLRERQLRLHTDMHRGVARYVCPVCEQGAFLKHDHVRHLASHLAAGEAICQVCFQIFPGGEQLRRHMDAHLYVCGVCGDKFRLRKDMRSHYNSHHAKVRL